MTEEKLCKLTDKEHDAMNDDGFGREICEAVNTMVYLEH